MVERIREGAQDFTKLEEEGKRRIAEQGFRVDYLSVCNSKTLEPAAVDDREITVLGAMFTDAARLIDNLSLSLDSRGESNVH